MNRLIFFILIFSIEFYSCKTSKNNSEVKNIEQKNELISDSVTSIQNENLKHRFKVAFISSGRGIDRKTKDKYDQFIKKFEQDNKVTLVYEILRLGKEGETNYCFNLKELDEKQQESFISESIEILKSAVLVHVDENAECH
jgi:hypothetical protein